MTRDVEVPDGIFNNVRRHYNERQTVELTMLIWSLTCCRGC